MKYLFVPIFWIICLSIILFLLAHILTKGKRKKFDDVIAKITTLPV